MSILAACCARGEGAVGAAILLACWSPSRCSRRSLFPGDPLAIVGRAADPAVHRRRASARHRPAGPRCRWRAWSTARAPRSPSAVAAAAAALVHRHGGRHARRLSRRHRRRSADAHHRGLPDGARLPAGARPGQRHRAERADDRARHRHRRLDRSRRASRAPKCCRCASAISSRPRASSACTRLEIAFREVLPNALTPMVSLAAVIVAAAVLIEAALSFLGFGDPNRVTWGSMIAEGRTVLRGAPFLSIVPGVALVVTVLAVHLIGRGPRRRRCARRRIEFMSAPRSSPWRSLASRYRGRGAHGRRRSRMSAWTWPRADGWRVIGESGSGKSTLALAVAGLAAGVGRGRRAASPFRRSADAAAARPRHRRGLPGSGRQPRSGAFRSAGRSPRSSSSMRA